MKQFTLEEYLKNPSRKIITRDGREIKILYTEANHEYSIIALITNEDGIQFPRAFNKNGEYFHGIDSSSDLFFLEQECVDSSSTPKKNEKFNPKTLKPFDKVLVRDNLGATWFCTIFSHIYREREITYPYYTVSGMHAYCIPYNDDTKYLIGTTKEVPEYYRYWED